MCWAWITYAFIVGLVLGYEFKSPRKKNMEKPPPD